MTVLTFRSRRFSRSVLPLLAVAFAAAGTSCGPAESEGSAPPAAPELQRYVLHERPAAGRSVLEAKQAEPGTKLVVEGRVARIVKGFGVFTLVGKELPYCGETNKEDGCKTPWDYCCETSETITKQSLGVEVRDANGQPIAAATLPELRLLDHVAVAGTMTQDEHGNRVLLADGWFRIERPDLPADVRWP